MATPVWLLGAGGRTPFVGHFRGARLFGGTRLAWAGSIAGSAGVEEGWEAAEAARDALATVAGAGSPAALLVAACDTLARIDARWLARGDMRVLLVATEGSASWASTAGLAEIWAYTTGAWRQALPTGHPAYGEPGGPAGAVHSIATADRWAGVPVGATFPTGDIAAACGVRP